MKVLWLTNIPSPYRVEFFSMLGQKCDLTVVFEKDSSNERDGSWKKYSFQNFEGIILKGLKTSTDQAFDPGIIKYIRPEYDKIIVSNFLTPTGIFAVGYLKAKRIAYYLESDGGFYSKPNPLVGAIKKFAISNAKGYFSTGKAHDDYYVGNGADPSRLIRYPFSSYRECSVLSKPVTVEEKTRIRAKQGIPTNKEVVITVGQFIPRKGFDVLLKAVHGLDVLTYIIGGTPSQEYLELADENVRFLPFMRKKEIFQWFMAADLFVLPTRYDIWGLVVGEAMACGLPVITTSKCLAGLEMVQDGVNGYLVETKNVEQLKEKIIKALSEKTESMSLDSLAVARKYTLEKMVDKHIDVFEKKH